MNVGRFGQRTFWPGRFGLDVLATDVLASNISRVGRFGQIRVWANIGLINKFLYLDFDNNQQNNDCVPFTYLLK